ncbi:hypothetical protein ACLK1S_25685 [Escherichia coli]
MNIVQPAPTSIINRQASGRLSHKKELSVIYINHAEKPIILASTRKPVRYAANPVQCLQHLFKKGNIQADRDIKSGDNSQASKFKEGLFSRRFNITVFPSNKVRICSQSKIKPTLSS